MAGPSGAGYAYPGDWPAAGLGVFTRMTRRYMDRTGINAVTILNRVGGQDVRLDEAAAQRYMTAVRPLGVLEVYLDFWNGQWDLTARPVQLGQPTIPGRCSGVTRRDYERGALARLVAPHARVQEGKYRAVPARRVCIPARTGGCGRSAWSPEDKVR